MRENARFKVENDVFDLSDFHLCITSYSIGVPETKTQYVEIPYSNVVYDYTDYFGQPTYKQREITIECQLMKSTPCWHKILDTILERMHGKRGKIAFASDSEWWYDGRIAVDTNEHEAWNYATVSFTITCNPLKTNDDGDTRL